MRMRRGVYREGAARLARFQLLEPPLQTFALELRASVFRLGVAERLSGLGAPSVEIVVPRSCALDRFAGTSRRRLCGSELAFNRARLLRTLVSPRIRPLTLCRRLRGFRSASALDHTETALAEARRRTKGALEPSGPEPLAGQFVGGRGLER